MAENLTIRVSETGLRGASAYASWLSEGNVGTEADFLADIKGDAGPDTQESIDIAEAAAAEAVAAEAAAADLLGVVRAEVAAGLGTAQAVSGPSYLRPVLSPYAMKLFGDTDLDYPIYGLAGEWTKNDGSAIPRWQGGSYAHLHFADDFYMKNGVTVTLDEFFSSDLSARIDASGLLFGASNGPVGMLNAIGTALVANGSFAIEMEVTQDSAATLQTFFHIIQAGSTANQIKLLRRSTGDPASHLQEVLQTTVVKNGDTVASPTQGPGMFTDAPVWIRASFTPNLVRLQDQGGLELAIEVPGLFPDLLEKIWFGGTNTAAQLFSGHIRQIILWDTDRPFPVGEAMIQDQQQQTLNGVNFIAASPEKAHSLTFNRMRPENSGRFELRPGDVWENDVANGYAERVELSQDGHNPHAEPVGMAFSFNPEQFEVNSNYLIAGQMHGGPGRPPWFGLALLEDGSARISVRYIDVAGTDQGVMAEVIFAVAKGEWHDFVFEYETGVAGVFQVSHKGVLILDYSGPCGYLDEADSGYWRTGAYREQDPTNTVIFRFANIRIGTTDLSALIANPDPILGE